MKYSIKLLTRSGQVTEVYTDTQDLKEFEQQMFNKYGTFVMLSSNKI